MTHKRSAARASICITAIALMMGGITSTASASHATAAKVSVTLTETHLAVSRSSLQAGKATFVVVNDGHKLQALAITGPGINARTPRLARGRQATLTVTLRTGAYMLSDPLGTATTRWFVVTPATVVHATGNASPGATPTFDPTNPMTCD